MAIFEGTCGGGLVGYINPLDRYNIRSSLENERDAATGSGGAQEHQKFGTGTMVRTAVQSGGTDHSLASKKAHWSCTD